MSSVFPGFPIKPINLHRYIKTISPPQVSHLFCYIKVNFKVFAVLKRTVRHTMSTLPFLTLPSHV